MTGRINRPGVETNIKDLALDIKQEVACKELNSKFGYNQQEESNPLAKSKLYNASRDSIRSATPLQTVESTKPMIGCQSDRGVVNTSGS